MTATFTHLELQYLRSQRLGRLATVGRDGSPHVVPVGYRMGPESGLIEIGGVGLAGSKKWRDLRHDQRVAFVVDDLATGQGWAPRGIEVRGRAELHEQGGEGFGPKRDPQWFRIVPRRVVTWGLTGSPFEPDGLTSRAVDVG